MQRFSRRTFIAGGVALATGSAGCLSGGDESTPSPGIGTIAESTTPGPERPLPSPVAGNPDADVTVTAFEDYACPHCATYALDVFPRLASEYLQSETVRYEFHDFPIPVDETVSWQAANAARAVQAEAGPQAYFEYSEALFRDQSSLGPDSYASLAEDIGVDGATVRAAATDSEYDPTIRADRQGGQDRGVSGTPTVFVDGSEVSEPTYDAISAAIDSAVDR
ncbi:DsbA family protein [Halomicroarcula sp. F28]|uniref:DsbA family protein n=1 Tax=Haloarcula salinisoli TaxID=2487746 RepID=UPI001C739884|nr:thioredoxin domain-containing protein [Halomicroarcula salinisoli]MBX0285306.1 DsbA family protein [Halomicroarcula salinisoli]